MSYFKQYAIFLSSDEERQAYREAAATPAGVIPRVQVLQNGQKHRVLGSGIDDNGEYFLVESVT